MGPLSKHDAGTGAPTKNYILNGNTIRITATLIASILYMPLLGFNLAFSAVLIAQLEECEIAGHACTHSIFITNTDSSWIASLFTIFIPVGAFIGAAVMDSYGRLAVIRLAAVPGIVGWILLATASNIPMLLVGRALNGIAAALSACATFVYASEISKPNIRGPMITIPSSFGALGIALIYTMGYFLEWRTIAWITVGLILVGVSLTAFLPNSPVWLVSKGKIERARIALESLNKFDEHPKKETDQQLDALVTLYSSEDSKTASVTGMDKIRLFMEPTVYKPFFILLFLNIFVQFSGLNVLIFYAVTLFQDAGTNINPYIASILIGGSRFIASIFTVILMQRFGRRQLMVASGLIMTVTIGISGLYTKWIQEGTTTQLWVPMVMMALYAVATMMGFLGIPLSLPAELFPTEARGMGQSLFIGIIYTFAFASTRTYYDFNNALGGSAGLQLFFAAISLAGAVYTYIFLPETQKKSLHEIEEYFKSNSVYILHRIRLFRKQKTRKKEIDVKV